jgi:hypothetical protein
MFSRVFNVRRKSYFTTVNLLYMYIILKRKIKKIDHTVITKVNDQIQNGFHIVIFTHFYTDCIK